MLAPLAILTSSSFSHAADQPLLLTNVAAADAWLFSEPQRTMVDVYYGGRLVMSTPARYTIDTIEFLDPAQILDALPASLAPSVLLNHLQGEIATNGEKVCVAPDQPEGCGKIEPDFIGVIFDETKFRADVFVHPDLLAPPDPLATRYLPPPSGDSLGLAQGLSAVYSDSSDGDALYGLYGHTWTGKATQRAFAFWNSTDANGFGIQQLAWQNDYQDHQITVGLFESQFGLLRATRRDPIAGASFRRSLDRRLDLEELSGGDIQVFLANRSQVDILRDGRLIASGFYDAGNQRIDSAQLPPGAYNIEMRITDTAGGQRSITRFFVKTTLVAPADHPLYFLEAGRVLDRASTELLPEDAGTVLARGGYQWRYSDAIGMSIAAAATNTEFLPEFGAVWIGDRFDASSEIFASTSGDHGAALRGSWRWQKGSANLLTQRNGLDTRPVPDADYHLLGDESMFSSVSVGQSLWHGQGSASAYTSKTAVGDSAEGWSLRYSRNWAVGSLSTLTLSTELGSSDGDMFAEISASWRYAGGHWSHQARTVYRDSRIASRPDDLSLEVSSAWNDGDRFIDEWRAEANAIANHDLSTLSLEGQYRSEFGMARIGAQSTSGAQDNTQYSAMGDTSFIVADSKLAAGAPQQGRAGVILDLRNLPDVLLDVLVDGQRMFTTRGGRRVAVPLVGYRTYNITLHDRGAGNIVRFEQDSQQVTLYPGNTVLLEWKIDQVLIVIGRLVHAVEICDEAGACRLETVPVANAVVRSGGSISITADDGFFQLDLESGSSNFDAEAGNDHCRATVDRSLASDGILRLPLVECIPVVTPAQKPPAEEPAMDDSTFDAVLPDEKPVEVAPETSADADVETTAPPR